MAAHPMLNRSFGLLTVVARAGNSKDGSALWKCACQCGETRIVAGTGLRAGRNKSCGCASPRFDSERTKTHGKSRSRVYRIWHGMIVRCSESAKGKTRRNYFERGIRVCDAWLDFATFYEDMGDPPPRMTLERTNGEKGYEPGNCKWATPKEQANNTRKSSFISYQGERMTVAQWADRIGIKQNTLLYRLRRGATPHDALTRPVQRRIWAVKRMTEESALNETLRRMVANGNLRVA